MNCSDKLIEAVTYARDNQDGWRNWWQTFENIQEAKAILRGVKKEQVEEEEKICLIEAMDIGIEFDSDTIDSVYFKALKELKKVIEKYED